jgi:nicotinic acid mononucleotide adenylyltransferase
MSGEHIYLKSKKDFIEVSSTEIRQIIKNGDINLLKDKLPEEVIDYILKNNLYK